MLYLLFSAIYANFRRFQFIFANFRRNNWHSLANQPYDPLFCQSSDLCQNCHFKKSFLDMSRAESGLLLYFVLHTPGTHLQCRSL
jgi:hypothetical protein